MSVIIKAEGLGKKYTISHQKKEIYYALRDVMADSVKKWGRKVLHPLSALREPDPTHEEFWALKDVSFEINQGDRVGIIGRNGAGKSTLLKILSRITEPTKGRVSIHGRVASLLEVGTGFHPELTGRENVFLNGAILGMGKAEIKKKFDEIVAFAEVEKFLDTPVKRYSSGMYMRLAFAVAAHLDPEILIIDEVLAVGDAQFQNKCIGKMEAVGKKGRTLLFVSHNMGVVRQLCSKCFLIEKGEIVANDETNAVVELYLGRALVSNAGEKSFPEDPDKDFQVVSARLLNTFGTVTHKFECDEPILIEIICISKAPIRGLYGYFGVLNKDGTHVLGSDTFDVPPNHLDYLSSGRYKIELRIPERTLGHGDYSVMLNFTSSQSDKTFWVDRHESLLAFRLDDNSTIRGNHRLGFLSTLLKWEVSKI